MLSIAASPNQFFYNTKVVIKINERIDPRGLGTQLFSAASPNQVFYNTKVDGEDNGPQRDGALRQPGRSSERVVSVR